MKQFVKTSVFLFLLLAFGNVHAIIISLDASNNWTYELSPGATIDSQGMATNIGALIGTNVQFAFGSADTAIFPGQSSIGGGGALLGGLKPHQLATSNSVFTILDTLTQIKYEASALYFRGPDPFGGTVGGALPAGFTDPQSWVIRIPEPSIIALFGLGLAGMVAVRRRRDRQV